jgi:hypothetical protein
MSDVTEGLNGMLIEELRNGLRVACPAFGGRRIGAVDDHPQEPTLVPRKLGYPRRAGLADRKPTLATLSGPIVEAIEHRARDLPTRKEPADLVIVKLLTRPERKDVAALSPFALKAPKGNSTRKSRRWRVVGSD